METLQKGIARINEHVGWHPTLNNPERNQAFFQNLLTGTDVNIVRPTDEARPWDIVIRSSDFYTRILRDGVTGAAEGYVAGDWDCSDIADLTDRIYRANIAERLGTNKGFALRLAAQHIVSRFDRSAADEVAKRHYDLPPLLFERMLGERQVYSCGYWPEEVETLDQAQEAKLALIAQKLQVEPGMRVLDIGGGAGGLAGFLAAHYGVKVVNTGVSREQIDLANRKYADLDVENRFQDYREINDGPYDRIVSVGMFEHVGKKPRNYKKFMGVVQRNLAEDGIFLLHTIGTHVSKAATSTRWVDENIFPNSRIPTYEQIARAVGDRFVVHHEENIGPHYDPTLLAWNDNFEQHWEEIQSHPHFKENPEAFRRMWRLYLLGSAGMFRAGRLQVWQFIMTRPGRHYEVARPGGDGLIQTRDVAYQAESLLPSDQNQAQGL